MENVVLIVHLLLAVGLIAIVLLQRSEGGGLGMGGGGSGGGVMSSRGAATALNKVTWILAAAFICTSITLTVLNAASNSGGSVLDNLAPVTDGNATGADILPPSTDEDELLPVAE
ncbi:MAG: preprotein translocase subunit SecG [Pseudomonadota bacterium]